VRILAETRWVSVEGRDHEVGPLTVQAVALALDLFGAQIEVCRKSPGESAACLPEILRTCGAADLRRALASCVRGRPPDSLDALVALAVVALELTDVPEIGRALDSLTAIDTAVAEAADDADELSPGDLAVVAVGARFGAAPHEVYRWPYTAFLAAASVLREPGDGASTRTPSRRGRSIPIDQAFPRGGITARPKVEA
jgi:hypothetical protein